ncbi:hypothetical protein BH10BAC5_BH10BAC5_26320 [soil metagenome]
MELEIRKYEAGDIDDIVEMQKLMGEYHLKFDKEFYQPSQDSSHELSSYLRKKLDDKEFNLLIADQNGNAVGYVMGWLTERPPIYEKRKTAYLSNIFVKDDFRNSGAGKKLYEEMEKWFFSKEIDFIEINADARNTETIEKFRKSGFKDLSITFYKKVHNRNED